MRLEASDFISVLMANRRPLGNSLVVQWLRIRAPTAGGTGSIPGWGPKIPHAKQCGQKEKKKRRLLLVEVQSGDRSHVVI